MLIAMQGVPGSGKTTWINENRRKVACVSRDALRRMLHGQAFNQHYEQIVKKLRDKIIRTLLEIGWDVIVDETCVNGTAELERIAEAHSTPFVVQRMDTPLEVCIERDSERPEPVGELIIRKMWEKLNDL